MNAPRKPTSKRFTPSTFTQRLVPFLLLLLLMALAAITALVILAGLGII
jgi:hypothetical protein